MINTHDDMLNIKIFKYYFRRIFVKQYVLREYRLIIKITNIINV